ncbi:MAG: hypothetical protein IJ856_03715 [Candidatus Methanomethylophilaceae archaeon]|nr:hypothetical protein [Candidatus Methanomethylophilaceae archaeon]
MEKTKMAVALLVAVAAIVAIAAVVVTSSHGGDDAPVERKYMTDLTDSGKVYSADGGDYKVMTSTYTNPLMPEAKLQFYYSDGYFAKDPKEYDEHLASMTLVMASTGFGTNGGYSDLSSVVREFFDVIGCGDVHVNSMFDTKPGEDTIGVAMAQKKITVGGTEKTLVPVVMRSANYDLEWVSNFTVGTEGESEGFASAATQVMDELIGYMKDCGIDGDSENVLFWISGYSRGAATSNLVAKRVVDMFDNKGDRTFCYTFEAPTPGLDSMMRDGCDYGCIHNVFDRRDIVTLVPPTEYGFKHYGIDHFVPGLQASTVYEYVDTVEYAGETTTVTTEVDNFDSWATPVYPLWDEYEKRLWDTFHMKDHAKFQKSVLKRDTTTEKLEDDVDIREFLWDMIHDLLEWTGTDRQTYASGDLNLQGCMQKIMHYFNDGGKMPSRTPFDLALILMLGSDPGLTGDEMARVVDTISKGVDKTTLQGWGLSEEEAEFLAKFVVTFAYNDYSKTFAETGIRGYIYIGTLAGGLESIYEYHMPFYLFSWLMTYDDYYA